MAWTDVFRIRSVSSRKSRITLSSTTRVRMVLAPVIPSLKFPVIREFSSRIFRFSTTSRLWKNPVSRMAMGRSRRSIAESSALIRNMTKNTLMM